MYTSPFSNRYGSDTMRRIFDDRYKFVTWRKLWVALARAEQDLGLNITDEQINEMGANVNNIPFHEAREYEKETKHDVMAHILAFGDQCPAAKPIIHLGATSCYVTDNTDVILQARALLLVRQRLIEVLMVLIRFARQYDDVVTVGYTHYQAAQPTTVGKRACMWIQDLIMDLDEVSRQLGNLKFLGCKGATGTAASFLELFDGNEEKVEQLEQKIAEAMGFDNVFPISGQTYTRKQDFNVIQCLAGIAQSASKFANDIRLLSNLGEVVEARGANQVGSSAMPYKANPINCERINSLGRLVISHLQSCATTTATQWMERTLDDSANRRIIIPESFIAIDEILITYTAVINRLYVNRSTIRRHVLEHEYLFLTEPILMHAVKHGGDRQELHGKIRKLIDSVDSTELWERVVSDPDFHLTEDDLSAMRNKLSGLAVHQTRRYLDSISSYE